MGVLWTSGQISQQTQKFFRSFLIVSSNAIPPQCIKYYRRCLLPSSRMAAANNPKSWKLLCSFNAIILAPQSPKCKWPHTIRERLELFSHGNWDLLLDGEQKFPIYKSNSRPPTTTPPNPPDDRAKRALQAQAEFFSSKSITKAVKSIISKSEHSVTAEQMVSKLKKLYRNPRDLIPLSNSRSDSYKQTRRYNQAPPNPQTSSPSISKLLYPKRVLATRNWTWKFPFAEISNPISATSIVLTQIVLSLLTISRSEERFSSQKVPLNLGLAII